MASESKYQRKLINKYESEGWFVMRLITVTTTIAKSGVPDLVMMRARDSGGFDVKFVEVKAKRGVTSKIQEYVINKLKEIGFEAEIDREL